MLHDAPFAPQGLQHGARTYGQVLGAAGGAALEQLMRREDRSAVCTVLYASPPYDLRVPALPVSRLSITLTPATVRGGIAGERPRCYETRRHSLFLTPAGADAHWRKEAPSRHLNIYFHAEAFDGHRPASDAILNASLPGLRPLADQLLQELRAPDEMAAEAADSLARLMLILLARRSASTTSANPLTPQVLTRLRDYVAAHLAERILVADLAAVAGMTPNGFAHAYASRTGQSPHQFVLAQRLEHAMALLRHSPLGVAEVAAATGFASQQHLGHTMRRRLGTTPGRYRASLQAQGLPCPDSSSSL